MAQHIGLQKIQWMIGTPTYACRHIHVAVSSKLTEPLQSVVHLKRTEVDVIQVGLLSLNVKHCSCLKLSTFAHQAYLVIRLVTCISSP